MTEPTERDRENARVRQEIAERFQREYDQVLAWAEAAFGQGWLPSHRHFLLDKEDEDRCRYTAERPTPAATVYTVKNAQGEQRHFTVNKGVVTECSGYQEGFGPLLAEPHPTMRIEVKGQLVAPHRFSLCWAPIETYRPRSPESLAAAREKREAKAVAQQAADNPLFRELILSGEYRVEKKPRGR